MLVTPSVSLEKLYCKECRGDLIHDLDRSEQICSNCGIVTENAERTDYFSSDISPSRSMLREEPTSNMAYFLNLPTVINSKNVDAYGKQISSSYELGQLRRWNKFSISRDWKRNNELKAISEIDRIIEMLGLSKSVAKYANEIYHKQVSGAIRRKSIAGMSAASVLVACYLLGIPSPVDEIEKMSLPVSGKLIRRYYKLLLREIGIRVTNIDPCHEISKIAANAGLSGRSERKALAILASVKDNATLAGKRPVSIAVAALYLASIQENERTNQLRLAFAAGVTPATLRKRSLEITRILDNQASLLMAI